MNELQIKYIKHLFLVAITYILGVCLHECGHYLGSFYEESGRNKHISYRMFRWETKWSDSLAYVENMSVNDEGTEKLKYYQNRFYFNEMRKSASFMLICGIGFNFLVGWFSFLLLFVFKSRVFLYPSFFLGESVITLLIDFFRYQIAYKLLKTSFGEIPDLLRFSNYTGLPYLTVEIFLCSISIPALSYILLKIIPQNERSYFLLTTCFGTVLGHIVWFYLLGKWLLPMN